MKIKDGYYFLCPKCLKLVKNLSEVRDEVVYYDVSIGENGEPEFEQVDFGDSECCYVRCYECNKEMPTKEIATWETTWEAVDFLVKIENGKILPHGDYWHENLDELKEIAKELNLEVLKK